jgi:hypothetical protein
VITTYIYNYTVNQSFAYGPRLTVYDARTRRMHRLESRSAAAGYLDSTPRIQCPRQRTFAWGLPTSRYSPFK